MMDDDLEHSVVIVVVIFLSLLHSLSLSLSLPSISNLFLTIPTEDYFDGFFTQLVILQVNCRERATLSENFVAHSMLMGFVVFVGGRL